MPFSFCPLYPNHLFKFLQSYHIDRDRCWELVSWAKYHGGFGGFVFFRFYRLNLCRGVKNNQNQSVADVEGDSVHRVPTRQTRSKNQRFLCKIGVTL